MPHRKVISSPAKAAADLVRPGVRKTESEWNALPPDGLIEGLGHLPIDVAALTEPARFWNRGHIAGGINGALDSVENEPHGPAREVADDLPLLGLRHDAEPPVRISRKLPEPLLLRKFRGIRAGEQCPDSTRVRLGRRPHPVANH